MKKRKVRSIRQRLTYIRDRTRQNGQQFKPEINKWEKENILGTTDILQYTTHTSLMPHL